jgi:hypothetical protein
MFASFREIVALLGRKRRYAHWRGLWPVLFMPAARRRRRVFNMFFRLAALMDMDDLAIGRDDINPAGDRRAGGAGFARRASQALIPVASGLVRTGNSSRRSLDENSIRVSIESAETPISVAPAVVKFSAFSEKACASALPTV